jgi:hypothetical protein
VHIFNGNRMPDIIAEKPIFEVKALKKSYVNRTKISLYLVLIIFIVIYFIYFNEYSEYILKKSTKLC